MLADRYGDSIAVRPITRYQVRLVPIVLYFALVAWLAVASFVAERWASGFIAVVLGAVLAMGWLLIRRRRLRRASVLPLSPRREHRRMNVTDAEPEGEAQVEGDG